MSLKQRFIGLGIVFVLLIGIGFIQSVHTELQKEDNDSVVQDINQGASSYLSELAEDEEFNESKVEKLVHRNINHRREKRGLSQLKYSSRLEKVAEFHSKDMSEKGYLGHDSPSGRTMSDRYERFDINCRIDVGSVYQTGGENVLQTYYKTSISTDYNGSVFYDTNEELAHGIVRQWMNSEGHRENILEPYWRREGIDIETVKSSEGLLVYATQNFC